MNLERYRRKVSRLVILFGVCLFYAWEELGLEPSESDYKAALKRIESLFDVAEPGSPEGDELEKLAVLVEEYEAKIFLF